ncbi:MAG: hypothetical protein LKF96_08245 [Treponema sp.]|jgi:hypothetical protein|nr:hypothetical protein [Treponema sp.]
MKRILPLLCMMMLAAGILSAQDSDQNGDVETEPQDQYEYKMNGTGDQFIKIALMGSIPLNFGDQLYTGGAAELGYYRFLNSWFATGGSIMFAYNTTLGSNIFTYVPITVGFMFQPSVWKLEFPITLGVGAAFENYLSNRYFPGLILKPEAGIFYRLTESWSLGAEASFIYMPQWYVEHPEYNDYGLFVTAKLCARYHF